MIWGGLYILFCLPAMRWGGRAAISDCDGEIDGEYFIFAFIAAAMSGVVAPFIYLYLAGSKIANATDTNYDQVAGVIFGRSKEDKVKTRETAVTKRENRIALLEREAGL